MDLTDEYLEAKRKAGKIKRDVLLGGLRAKHGLKMWAGQEYVTKTWKEYINYGLALVAGFAVSHVFGRGWKALIYLAAGYIAADVAVIVIDAVSGGKIQKKLEEAEKKKL